MPIKNVASIQKLFFHDSIFQILFIFTIHRCTKFRKNATNLGNFLDAATIQERPLLARVQYVEHEALALKV